MSDPAPTTEARSTILISCLLAWLFLIVYASCYPFAGWRTVGLAPFAYFTAGFSPYWTWFDVITNVLGYIPLGFFLVLFLYPGLRGWRALLLSVVLGAILSALLEAIQTYLPSRVPSLLDWLTNLGGTLLGALLGVGLAAPVLRHSKLLSLRQRWFSHEASLGLVVLGLWPLAQIYPQAYLFGNGQFVPVLSDWLLFLLDKQFDLAAWLQQHPLSVQQFWLAETLISACGMTGAVLTLLCLLRKAAPQTALILVLCGVTVLVKTLACALLFAPENAFIWFTPGAQGGCVIGLMMLSGLAYARPTAQRRLAVLTIFLSVLIINIIPANPYFTATLQAWVQGKFLNFNGAAQFLSFLWPFLALWFLLHPAHTLKSQ